MQQKIENSSAELLHHHCKYGHIPFKRLKSMAEQGIIPKYLAKTPTPACVACLYGRATRRKWRQRAPKHKKRKLSKVSAPGERVSVDMLQSPYPGLVAQMTDIQTKKRYNYATIYIDNFSGFSYIHLQKSADIKETLESKRAFEMVASQHGVKIKSYHADNRIFRANGWTSDCANKSQTLTFAGVNAHHQNGRAERRIRFLQELTRTQMIHIKHKWKTIEVAPQWPYAMRIANECLNNSPNMQHPTKRSAAQLFGNTEIDENPIHRQPFGAPTYVLQSPLQNNQPFHKWKHRSKLALYLGPPPFHARNVSLVMDLQTGLLSPQFHAICDPTFSTVKNDNSKYYWSTKAGFTAQQPKQPVPQLRKTQTQKRGHNFSDRHYRKKAKLESQHVPQPDPHDRNMSRTQSASVGHTNSDKTESTSEAKLGSSQPLRKSQRKRKPTLRLLQEMMSEITSTSERAVSGELFCFSALFPDLEDDFHEDPLQAYKATTNPDIMYYHEAMKEKDRKEFILAMKKEMDQNFEEINFEVVPRSSIPKDATVLRVTSRQEKA